MESRRFLWLQWLPDHLTLLKRPDAKFSVPSPVNSQGCLFAIWICLVNSEQEEEKHDRSGPTASKTKPETANVRGQGVRSPKSLIWFGVSYHSASLTKAPRCPNRDPVLRCLPFRPTSGSQR